MDVRSQFEEELTGVCFSEVKKDMLKNLLSECAKKQRKSRLFASFVQFWHGSTEITPTWGLACLALVALLMWKSYAPILFVDQTMAAAILQAGEVTMQEIKTGVSLL